MGFIKYQVLIPFPVGGRHATKVVTLEMSANLILSLYYILPISQIFLQLARMLLCLTQT